MSFVKSILQQWRDRNLKKNTYVTNYRKNGEKKNPDALQK